MGGNELTFTHFFQTTEKHTESFLFQEAQPTTDSQPSVHLEQTVQCIQENQLSGSYLVV